MIALLILLLLSSCMKTEIINQPMKTADTTQYKPRKELPQQVEDTTRYEIGFNPSVEDWEEIEENL
jgi:hypothetical protein